MLHRNSRRDETHAELIHILEDVQGAIAAGQAARVPELFGRLVLHTERHFTEEERWMGAIGVPEPSARQHVRQHAKVLELMREVLRLARDGDRLGQMNIVVTELIRWFPEHTERLDAELARYAAAAAS